MSTKNNRYCDLQFTGTEDPAQLAAALTAWEAIHGPHTHVLFYFGKGRLALLPRVGFVALTREQQVLPCASDAPSCSVWHPKDHSSLRRAEELSWMSYAYVPVGMMTGEQDNPQMIKAQKRAGTRYSVGPSA